MTDGTQISRLSGDAEWRLLLTDPETAAYNMACDEVLGNGVTGGHSKPTIRFFQWSPPAISFGYSQIVENEVNLDMLRDAGIDVVRRITGGRAVLHADEVTYSVICAESDPMAAGGITATYARISEGLVEGIRALGVDAVLARTSDPSVPLRDRQATVPCFGSTTRAEITVGGRKLVGSAQHRMRGLMIQHGSILVGPEHLRLIEFLNAAPELRERYASRLSAATTSLKESGWSGNDRGEIIGVLADGMRRVLGIDLTAEYLSTDEIAATEQLSIEKYAADWWNLPEPGTSPRRLSVE
jgi:lipoyl(octanoyl) transferase